MLIHLMENYVREETERLNSDNTINELMTSIEDRYRETIKNQMRTVVRSLKDDEGPILPKSSNDNWEVVNQWSDLWGDR